MARESIELPSASDYPIALLVINQNPIDDAQKLLDYIPDEFEVVIVRIGCLSPS